MISGTEFDRKSQPPRPIGSFFESDDSFLSAEPQDVPQAVRMADAFVETGRQALNAIVRDLLGRGVQYLFLPGHLCESMLTPFLVGQMKIYFLPMAPDLQIDLQKLDELESSTARPRSAVLMARYFGHARDADYIEQIQRLQSRETIVIEDLTHALFDKATSSADYTFASLKKLLPLSSGAVLSGTRTVVRDTPERGRFHNRVWRFMDAKRDFLAGKHSSSDFYAGLVSATHELQAVEDPHTMDIRSKELLPYLAYDRIIGARRANFAMLVDHLDQVPGLDILSKRHSYVATHLVVATSGSQQLRRHLAGQRIYCPVHWPKPAGMPKALDWPTDHFSIPLDQRYGSSDMLRVVSAVERFVTP